MTFAVFAVLALLARTAVADRGNAALQFTGGGHMKVVKSHRAQEVSEQLNADAAKKAAERAYIRKQMQAQKEKGVQEQAEGHNIKSLVARWTVGGSSPLDDYISRDELEAWERAGNLKLFVAFSRKKGTPKTYVQNLISQQAAMVAECQLEGQSARVCRLCLLVVHSAGHRQYGKSAL